MKRLLSLILLAALLLPTGASAAYNVWLDNSLKKYRQGGEDGTSGASTLTIGAARNEIESFQILIYADGETLTGVDVTVGNFTKDADVVDDIYIYKQDYVNCTRKSRVEYELGQWPDALLPKVDRYYREVRNTFPFAVEAGKVQGVWVDVGTVNATVPGTYTAPVTVSAAGKADVVRTVTLTVWDFELPSTPTFQYTMVNMGGNVAVGFGFPYYLDTSYFRELMAVHNKMALYHKLSLMVFNWVTMQGDSNFLWNTETKTLSNISWSPWDTVFTPAITGTAITSGPYVGARFANIDLPVLTPAIENKTGVLNEDKASAARQYLQLVYDKLEDMDADPFNHMIVATLDEPQCGSLVSFRGVEMSECNQTLLQLQDAASIDTRGKGPFKRGYTNASKRTGLTDVELYGFHSQWSSNVACPQWDPDCLYSTPKQRDLYTAANWWNYMGCANNACGSTGDSLTSNQIDLSADAPMYYNRMGGFVWARYEATGSIYWRISSECSTAEGNNPYDNIWSAEFGSNGDGHLVYPGLVSLTGRTVGAATPALGGTHDIPVESIRLKAVRDFVEDYEYAHILKGTVGRDAMFTEVNKFFTNTDPDKMYWFLNKNATQFATNRAGIAQLIVSSAPGAVHTRKFFRAGNKHFRVGGRRALLGE